MKNKTEEVTQRVPSTKVEEKQETKESLLQERIMYKILCHLI